MATVQVGRRGVVFPAHLLSARAVSTHVTDPTPCCSHSIDAETEGQGTRYLARNPKSRPSRL